jgi:hypothetical protein
LLAGGHTERLIPARGYLPSHVQEHLSSIGLLERPPPPAALFQVLYAESLLGQLDGLGAMARQSGLFFDAVASICPCSASISRIQSIAKLILVTRFTVSTTSLAAP